MTKTSPLDSKMIARIEADFVRRFSECFGDWTPFCEEEASDLCESPIEHLFYLAWMSRCKMRDLSGCSHGGSHITDVNGPAVDKPGMLELLLDTRQHECTVRSAIAGRSHRSLPHGEVTIILTQVPVGKYRADFVIASVVADGEAYRVSVVAVECDGKAFHDAHSTQVDRDRARDRVFQEYGLPVIRFTGSELYRNFAGCVDQVDSIIENSPAAWVKFGSTK